MTATSAFPLVRLVAAVGAGCAADAKNPPEAPAPHEYRTGSNIAKREAMPTTDEERARAIEQANELKRNSSTGRPNN